MYKRQIYNRAVASIERIKEVLNMPTDENQLVPEDASTLGEVDPSVPEIEFKNVSFSYLGVKNDLENISFALYPGETLGIMGPTGSGKSTVIRLLLRQYDVQEGAILIRGQDIRTINPEALNHLFGIDVYKRQATRSLGIPVSAQRIESTSPPGTVSSATPTAP